MKITLNLILVVFATTLMSCSSNTESEKEAVVEAIPVETYSIDLGESELRWTGKMLGLYEHTGILKFISGTFSIQGDIIVGGDFVVDMKSMSATDSNYDEQKTMSMLLDHLGSQDFFDIQNFPEASFHFNESNNGFLAIKEGKEKVEIGAPDITRDGENLRLKSFLMFNRKDFGVSFDHPLKDNVISNEVELVVVLVTKKVS